jgi:hypothetical protein
MQSLKPGGIFVGELFGTRDAWNTTDAGMNFHTRSEVENLLRNLHTKQLIEDENDRNTASGQRKHWHVFHIIAQR